MKFSRLMTVMTLAGILFPALGRAQSPAEAEAKPIRVLVTYGGHDFQEQEFWSMWDSFPGVTYTKAPLPESADLLQPGLEKDYDVVVLYDMFTGFTPEQRERFRALVTETGIGLVALHHSAGSHRDWPGYAGILGGKYVMEPETIDGQEYPASTFHHDQDVDVSIADPSHPITRGVRPFQIHDETYGGLYVAPEVHVLLTIDHATAQGPVVWAKTNGKSRVVVNVLGHDNQAWSNPAFAQILRQSLDWVIAGD